MYPGVEVERGWLTPEEGAWIRGRCAFQISSNCSYSLDSLGAGSIAGKQDIKVREVRLFQAGIDFRDFVGSRTGTLELLVACVIALGGWVVLVVACGIPLRTW